MFKESNTNDNNSNSNSSILGLNTTVFGRAFLSGSISGIVAAIFTNPFDVGKTRMQVSFDETKKMGTLGKLHSTAKQSMFRYMYTIYSREGLSALYVGLLPRCLKISPSCAIMISSYEVTKRFFTDLKVNAMA
ncbi:unnamed protein product [Ambrosiozyma monospora]|uniref:Unnamed protein product n=1 Tax=Ambrosiozyma monospora TaxID=43982 RepID=A0ACB5SWQ2_AMBMO|nr:unnamed protein product [Ambrosiozyma monospora]